MNPEGTVRHWPELGDVEVFKDQIAELNSEVAYELYHIESKSKLFLAKIEMLLDNVHRFFLSTTTSSFFLIEIYQGAGDRMNQMIFRNLDINKKGAFTRRMSALIFGAPMSDNK